MDSLTQFLMGAAIGQLILGPKKNGQGALLGGLAGTLPDLDVIPLMNTSVIDQLIHHRGFTHSILFCLGSPWLLAWACIRFWHWNLTFMRWFWFWFLAFFTHIILDWMTTWGTQLLWPSMQKFSLNALFIIDPLVAAPLLIGCIWSRIVSHHKPILIGTIFMCCYMVFALGAQYSMEQKFKAVFKRQSLSIDVQLVRPTPFNTLFWAVTAQTNEDKLIMGYARLWDSVDSIKLSQPIARRSDLLTSFKNHDDIHHVLAVTGGYYVIETSEQNLVIKDARFGIISGWNFPSETSFIFNYNLNLANNTWSQSRPAMPHASYLFKSLARAIFK